MIYSRVCVSLIGPRWYSCLSAPIKSELRCGVGGYFVSPRGRSHGPVLYNPLQNEWHSIPGFYVRARVTGLGPGHPVESGQYPRIDPSEVIL